MARSFRPRRRQLADSLWSRARQGGAVTEIERRNFGVADDIYAAGLLLAFLAFVPFCEPGSIDGPSLQRCAPARCIHTRLPTLLGARLSTRAWQPSQCWEPVPSTPMPHKPVRRLEHEQCCGVHASTVFASAAALAASVPERFEAHYSWTC